MAYSYKSSEALAAAVNSVPNSVRQSAWNDAMDSFKLFDMVPIKTISEDSEKFEYEPKKQRFVFGDIVPASCSSKPMPVKSSSGDVFKGFTFRHQAVYDLCIEKCNKKTVSEDVYDGEADVATVLMTYAQQSFYFGNPEMMQFGLVNHPLTEEIESPATWAKMSNSQIVKQLRTASKHMVDPRYLLADKVFDDSLGDADNAGNGSSGCGTRLECLTSLMSKQNNINFGEFEFNEELDSRLEFGGKNVALIYDADAMAMTLSGPIYLDARGIDIKNVYTQREINTGGLHVYSEGAVKLITGI